MDAGLIKGEGFAIDASVIEADASRYHGKAPGDIDWSLPERQTRAAAEFLGGLEDEDPDASRKLPKAISQGPALVRAVHLRHSRRERRRAPHILSNAEKVRPLHEPIVKVSHHAQFVPL
jgi:hypothetical protein